MELDVPLVLARWLHFASLMVVFGTSLFPFYALPPCLGGTALPALAKADRYARPASYLALASGMVWVAGSIIMMTGDPASLVDGDTLKAFFLATSFGPVWLLRLVILMGLVVVPGRHRARRSPSAFRLIIVFLAGAALASQAWLGHAAMSTGAELSAELGSYITHVIAAGAWIGGLLPLGHVLADQSRRGDDGLRACKTVLVRFSKLGMVAVSLVLASGIANSAFRLRSAHDLVATGYGVTILCKALLFVVMLIAAAVNRWWLMPRMKRGALGAIEALRRNIVVEQALAALVLAAAAVLGTLPP